MVLRYVSGAALAACVFSAAALAPAANAVVVVPPPAVWTAPVVVSPAIDYHTERLQQQVLAGPAGSSVLVSGDEGVLSSASRAGDTATWSTPVTIAVDGDYYPEHPYAAFDAAASPVGEASVVWTGWSGQDQVVEVATRNPSTGSWSAPVALAQGTDLGLAHTAYAADGTQAVVWCDDDAVHEVLRAPGSSTWSVPVTVSDPVPGAAVPRVQDPAVAFSGDSLVVSWQAYDGEQTSNDQRIYRLRAAEYSLSGEQWSASEWVSPAGWNTQVTQLAAGSDGEFIESWISDTGNQAAVKTATGWSEPHVFSMSNGGMIATGAAPDGSFAAAWEYPDTGPEGLFEARYTDADGWSATRTLESGAVDIYNSLQFTSGGGRLIASWVGGTMIGSTSELVARLVDVTPGVDAVPQTVPGSVGLGLEDLDTAVAPSGLVTVSFNATVGDLSHPTHGRYALEALTQIPPTVAGHSAPRITGVAAVGHRLTATDGTWAPQPTSYGYVWFRDGHAIPRATNGSYVLGIADATHRITVTVTAHAADYLDAASTSAAVLVPRPALHNSVRPVVAGTAVVGHVLTARAGSWTPSATKYTFTWLRNGKPIVRANGARYLLTAADRKKSVSVTVTASRPQYVSAHRNAVPVTVR